MKIKTLAFCFASLTQSAFAQPLPDGEFTRFGNWSAWLSEPTTRYAHGALGDNIEASAFVVEHNGEALNFILDDLHVFEDLRVRLVQLDSDAAPEAVIIRSHVAEGASIAIYDIDEGKISLKADTSNIGTAHRWLNIVGFGDFTGRGKTEIAAVITPHLAGSLRIYEIAGIRLVELARTDGYTNHFNGTRELDLANVSDRNGDGVLDIALRRIGSHGEAIVTFAGGQPRELP